MLPDSRSICGLIALCDLYEAQRSSGIYRFSVREMAQLDNGDVVVLRSDLGWSQRYVDTQELPELQAVMTMVGNVLLPDDDDDEEPHPWEYLAFLAAARGLSVTPQQLREVPYCVYLSDEVINLCTEPR